MSSKNLSSATPARPSSGVIAGVILLSGILVVTNSALAQTPPPGQTAGSAALSGQISLLNDAVVEAQSSGAATGGLVRRRAALFSQLIAADPAAALRSALPAEAAARLGAGAQAVDVESRGEWEGRIEAVVADDFEHRRSETRRYLQTQEGSLEIFFSTRAPMAGEHVRIRGLRLGNRMAVETALPRGPAPNVTDTNDNVSNPGLQGACTTTGQQKIAVIMLTTPSSQAFPTGYTQASLQQVFFGGNSDSGATASLNAFWKEVSYNQASATGQVFGPFALKSDYDYSTHRDLAQDAVSAADGSVDFTQFTRVAYVFPSVRWGGFVANSSVGCNLVTSPSKGSLRLSESWFPAFPNSQPSVGILAHEMGHALGLSDSSSEDFGAQPLGPLGTSGAVVDYGDSVSSMGSGFGHYTAQDKSILHWLNSGSGYPEVTAPGAFSVLPFETAGSSRALHILRDAGASAWLWLEYRQPLAEGDRPQPAGSSIPDGALIRYEDPTIDTQHGNLLDFNGAAAPKDFSSAALTPGHSWQDPFSPLTLTVNSASSTGLNVSVGYDPQCAKLRFPATSFPATGGTGTIVITAPETCNWTASSTADWISFVGQTSGSGNGFVSFVVAQNGGSYQQEAYIYLQRQSMRITARGTAVNALGVRPVFGSGETGRFTFQFDDPDGSQDLTYAHISFGVGDECQVQVHLPTRNVWLVGDGGALTGPVNLATAGATIRNSNCSVGSTGSSITSSGTQAELQLQMSFFAAFAGGHRVTSSIGNPRVTSNTIAGGTWIVPAAQPIRAEQQPGVTIQASETGAPFSADGVAYQAPATFNWASGTQHTVTWLTSGPQAGARYTFQSWSDGGANPRTITASDSSATYTATIKAQYLLSLGAAPANGGGLTASPLSADGYYDSGVSVAVSASAATGYAFGSFSGDLTGGAQPQTVVMTGPRSVTGNFNCTIQYPAYIFGPVGPGAAQGIFQFQTGAGCAWTLTSDSSWLTFNGPATGSGSNSQSYSIATNAGASRTARATVALSGGLPGSVLVRQDANGSLRPSIVLLTPQTASGLSQTFSMQLFDPGDVQSITDVFVNIDSFPSTNACDISFSLSSGQWYGTVNGASGSVPLGGSQNISNGVCQLNGSQFAFTGSGTSATLTFGITFQPLYASARTIAGGFHDSQNNINSAYQIVGQFTVSPTSQAIAFPAIANIPVTTAPFTLNATATSGLAVSYVSNSATVCTVSGNTVTILIAGGCLITATQVGDATYAAAAPVTQKFTVLFGDVTSADYFGNAVNVFAQDKITSGCGNNNYCPSLNVTRDQMAIFLVRAIYGSDNFTSSATPYFSDVPAGSFGFKWIQKMYELGITRGCAAGMYCPTALMTRDQMAVFVIRLRYGPFLAGDPPKFSYDSTPSFADVPQSDPAFAWIQRLKADRITSGCTPTAFCPALAVSRGDMAIFILRAAMNQFLPAGTPVISAISPSILPVGTSGTVTVTGTNTNFVQGVTTISPIPGITIGAVTVNSPTSLTVQLTAAAEAAAQPYSVLAITNSEEAVLPSGLIVQ